MKIVTALNSGGEFTPAHVQALKRQCDHYAPLTEFVCITNENVPGVDCIPDPNKWPGWWIKMNAFAPSMKGTILWMDLDTVIVGSLEAITSTNRLTLLRDFYRDGKRHIEGLQASLMLLPEEDRAEPYEYFSKSARTYMETYKTKGDQPLLERYYLKHAQRWQDVLPGQIVSWKVDCCGGNVFRKPAIPAEARIVIHHGTPRPWQCPEWEHLYR